MNEQCWWDSFVHGLLLDTDLGLLALDDTLNSLTLGLSLYQCRLIDYNQRNGLFRNTKCSVAPPYLDNMMIDSELPMIPKMQMAGTM